ncbi:protein IQ-DOMAIN 10-like [Bidens hawaiensis]|uniref:protein IQ-DOMAIN 10-like n=1 Tax=Bidens hawaiensis TaxID=980011 RepID=UPI00404A15FB
MGVCDWFKRRHNNKKKKENMPQKFESKQDPVDSKVAKVTAPTVNKPKFLTSNREYAATRIQTTFRAYKAKKTLSYLKQVSRFQELTKMVDALTKQASPALERLHFWSKIQAEISGRRLCKVAEGRMKQVKLQDRMRVASKIQKLERKWWSGPVIKEENGLKVQQIEKATNNHERALAYAFSHQWRPNSTRCFGQAYYDLSEESWGWNWTEPRIVVYKLEGHVVIRPIISPRARVTQLSMYLSNLA